MKFIFVQCVGEISSNKTRRGKRMKKKPIQKEKNEEHIDNGCIRAYWRVCACVCMP